MKRAFVYTASICVGLLLGSIGAGVIFSGDALAIPKSLRDYAIRKLYMQNGALVVNDTDGEIQFGDASEDISMGFSTSNTVVWSSDTGVTAWDLGATGASIILANDETIKNDNDGEIELGDGTEDLAFSFGTNACVLSSDTGVVEFDMGAVGTTVKLANDQTIVSDTDEEIQFGDTEDTSLGFGTSNEVTVTSDTGVTRWDFGDIGVKTGTPLFMVSSVRFCGNAANATTAVYMPPVQLSTASDMTTYEFGAAGCDGLDNTTETSGDDLLDGAGGLDVSVHGMKCGISAAGTDDTYTFQLRDDAADVTGVTCSVVLDGSAQQCEVLLDEPVVVAAGSLWAVQSAADTDDDVSSADVECQVFYSF